MNIEESEQNGLMINDNSPSNKAIKIGGIVSSKKGCIGCCVGVFGFILLCGGLLWGKQQTNPLCVNVDFSDFKVMNSDISKNWETNQLMSKLNLNHLLSQNKKHRRRLFNDNDYKYRAYTAIYLQVLYYSSDEDIINIESMQACHDIERMIKNYNGYHDHSLLSKNENNQIVEVPPSSFLNYVFPRYII